MRDKEKKLVSGIYHDLGPDGHRVFKGRTGRRLHISRAQIEALAAKLTCCDTCDTVATRSVTQPCSTGARCAERLNYVQYH